MAKKKKEVDVKCPKCKEYLLANRALEYQLEEAASSIIEEERKVAGLQFELKATREASGKMLSGAKDKRVEQLMAVTSADATTIVELREELARVKCELAEALAVRPRKETLVSVRRAGWRNAMKRFSCVGNHLKNTLDAVRGAMLALERANEDANEVERGGQIGLQRGGQTAPMPPQPALKSQRCGKPSDITWSGLCRECFPQKKGLP